MATGRADLRLALCFLLLLGCRSRPPAPATQVAPTQVPADGVSATLPATTPAYVSTASDQQVSRVRITSFGTRPHSENAREVFGELAIDLSEIPVSWSASGRAGARPFIGLVTHCLSRT
jgi:hypothetical protein